MNGDKVKVVVGADQGGHDAALHRGVRVVGSHLKGAGNRAWLPVCLASAVESAVFLSIPS